MKTQIYSQEWVDQYANGSTANKRIIEGCCVYHAVNNYNKKENGSFHLIKFNCQTKNNR